MTSAARRTVIFAGTSLTAGLGLEPDSAYPMLIQRKIDSAGLPFDVVNAGVSGETSAGLLDRLDWLLRGKFDVIVVETGANDGLRGLPVASLRANLSKALDRIRT
ncbi:MAG TPA: GDSL-type esterase/lipase family protein, partial [Gemmatimonadaceae bacterium]|nr:GDSL-type esterase/lipase family protein [Gemmatimonadaceae bacterium]